MNYLNEVTLSGLLHHLNRKKDHNYFAFSVRHENTWTDGTTRKDFLSARAFEPELQEKLKALEENAPIRVKGVLHSSIGSGELYLAVQEVEALNESESESGTLENSVKLSGGMHVIKAKSEGENGTGRYIRFAVKQESQSSDGRSRRDFLVVRVYDDALKESLSHKTDGEPVSVEGTLRSSKGSGVNYVRCTKLD
ncbi:MAG: hypothetical protein IJP48_05635 [Synergistaceae bacterium]|nr:hypothetical protein [Synergistaceae bacterium]